MESNSSGQILEFSKQVYILTDTFFLVATSQWSVLFIVWSLCIHSLMAFGPFLHWEVEENRNDSKYIGSIIAKTLTWIQCSYYVNTFHSLYHLILPATFCTFLYHVHMRRWSLIDLYDVLYLIGDRSGI